MDEKVLLNNQSNEVAATAKKMISLTELLVNPQMKIEGR